MNKFDELLSRYLNEAGQNRQDRIDILKSTDVLVPSKSQTYKIFEISICRGAVDLVAYKEVLAKGLREACDSHYDDVAESENYEDKFFTHPNNIAVNDEVDLGYFDIAEEVAAYVLGPNNPYYNNENNAGELDDLNNIIQLGDDVRIWDR